MNDWEHRVLTYKNRWPLNRNKRQRRSDCIAVWTVEFFCTKYVIRYFPGDHYIHMYWSSVPLDKSPILAYCPGPVLPVNHAHVVVTGEGRDTARATVPAEFIVDGKKAGPGKQFSWHKKFLLLRLLVTWPDDDFDFSQTNSQIWRTRYMGYTCRYIGCFGEDTIAPPSWHVTGWRVDLRQTN